MVKQYDVEMLLLHPFQTFPAIVAGHNLNLGFLQQTLYYHKIHIVVIHHKYSGFWGMEFFHINALRIRLCNSLHFKFSDRG